MAKAPTFNNIPKSPEAVRVAVKLRVAGLVAGMVWSAAYPNPLGCEPRMTPL